ncbi:uncharacterized protein PHACADRAFT_203174 [Phanerochaete carnosa HHB-10118-sp]|uniref:Uncharacterized protein n=1 Tax=Phanerochaete carnosa (strain HHB-10118-sp) TaxID=650164 RepID=K5WD96_PHACS|nr:uncharacterized protein PHACADRAFT_203174 [Phanerochaete carnosa HHB-10118-sp]EKM48152.1 hypothetical protein PHACADRAFT_203174 [Phanerochaete carnosa HHB-10118-sp]
MAAGGDGGSSRPTNVGPTSVMRLTAISGRSPDGLDPPRRIKVVLLTIPI